MSTKMVVPMVVQPIGNDPKKTLEEIRRLPGVKVYGFLLVPNPDDPLRTVLTDHWSELHYLTGEEVLVVATGAPARYAKGLEEYWKAKLGDAFEETWAEWQREPVAGQAFECMNLFDPRLKPAQLPCVVLFTDPTTRKAVVRTLPRWDADDLWRLLQNIFAAVRECAEKADESERLDCLRDVTSRSAVLRSHLEHVGAGALDYLKTHPAQILTTAVSFTLAFTPAGVPLGPKAIALLNALRKVLVPAP